MPFLTSFRSPRVTGPKDDILCLIGLPSSSHITDGSSPFLMSNPPMWENFSLL